VPAPETADLAAVASGEAAPEAPGRALVAADGVLRWSLAAALAAVAVAGPEPWLLAGELARPALGAGALALALDAAPRVAIPAILALAGAAFPGGAAAGPWLAVLGAAGARALLRFGPAGELLGHVRAARRRHLRAALATALRRSRAEALPEPQRTEELGRAGDAFEIAGRARSELRALGLRPAAWPAGVRTAAALLAPVLTDSAVAALADDEGGRS